MTIGERIQEARKKAGMKQSDLAEKLGVAVVTIGQYERGKRQPRLEQLRQIAAALNVSWIELAGDKSFEISVGTQANKRIQKALNTENAILELLRNIYGKAECKEVDGTYASSFYYLVGEGKHQFILYEEDFDTIKNLTLATIPIVVDRLKDSRPEQIVIDEFVKDLSSDETKKQMEEGFERLARQFPLYYAEAAPQSPPAPAEDTDTTPPPAEPPPEDE